MECKQQFFQGFRVITNLLTVKYYLSRPGNAVTQINPKTVKLGDQPKNERARRPRKAVKLFILERLSHRVELTAAALALALQKKGPLDSFVGRSRAWGGPIPHS